MISFSRITTAIITKRTKHLRECSNFTIELLLNKNNQENCLKCWRKSTHQTTTVNVSSRQKSKSAGIENKRNKFESNSKTSASATIQVPKPIPTLSAAVLIPVCVNNEGEISLLYTKRSGKLSRHVRQISFPGGMKDKTDASYEDCALRETEEEIGLSRNRVNVWGAGNVIEIPDRPPITPVIGIIENFSLQELKLNRNEVEEAFTVPIEVLCSPSTMRHTQFKGGYSIPVFLIDTNRRVWGITAVITRIFLNCFLPKGVYKHKVEFLRPYKIT